MDYLSIAEARTRPGLRLVLTAGVPGPWGEAAKAILRYKEIDFLPVLQEGGGSNEELLSWTGQTSAPVAMLDDELPRVGWLDLLMMAEQMRPEKPLLPAPLELRALVLGLSAELAGVDGLAWNRRLQMFGPMMQSGKAPEAIVRMAGKYGWSEQAQRRATQRIVDIVAYFDRRLGDQADLGSDYLVGDTVTALDFYAANFISMFKPLPPAQNPMPEHMRGVYSQVDQEIAAVLDSALFDHRQMMYQRHITLPLDF